VQEKKVKDSNESGGLPQQIEAFSNRFGHYPESVNADQIYRTRNNRAYAQPSRRLTACRERGIRLSGPPLGRPVLSEQAQTRQQVLDDAKVRNQIEGKFGQGKRRFSLGRIMAKLAQTAESMIAITFLVMNLERLLRLFLFIHLGFLMVCYQSILCHWRRLQVSQREFLAIG
jgi:transposase, IS5 family